MIKQDFLPLLEERQILANRLSGLIFGAPEVRELNSGKYIYVNYRENGKKITKYVGEYDETLYNVILTNTETAKTIKKEIKALDKQLKKLGYEPVELGENVRAAIDFARRHIITSINGQAVLEGVATTFAETEEILAGIRVRGIPAEDARKILNLKRAWDFILDEYVIGAEQDFGLLCQINKLVEEGFYYNAGKIRNVPVKIGGTTWVPELPLESQIKEELAEILAEKATDEEIAIDLLLYVMKKQIFIDGNKRTALIFANHFLISRGVGVIFVNEDCTDEYKRLLIEYYETGEKAAIVAFLKESLIEVQ